MSAIKKKSTKKAVIKKATAKKVVPAKKTTKKPLIMTEGGVIPKEEKKKADKISTPAVNKIVAVTKKKKPIIKPLTQPARTVKLEEKKNAPKPEVEANKKEINTESPKEETTPTNPLNNIDDILATVSEEQGEAPVVETQSKEDKVRAELNHYGQMVCAVIYGHWTMNMRGNVPLAVVHEAIAASDKSYEYEILHHDNTVKIKISKGEISETFPKEGHRHIHLG